MAEGITKEITDRIHELMDERGLKRYSLAKRCTGYLSKTSVYDIADGKKKVTVESLSLLCKGLDITLRDFFDFRHEGNINLSNDEYLTVECYRQLDEKRQGRLRGYLDKLLEEKSNED